MTIEDRYRAYAKWCREHDLPVLSMAEYEKQLSKVPEATLNNVDAILRNSRKKKDRK